MFFYRPSLALLQNSGRLHIIVVIVTRTAWRGCQDDLTSILRVVWRALFENSRRHLYYYESKMVIHWHPTHQKLHHWVPSLRILASEREDMVLATSSSKALNSRFVSTIAKKSPEQSPQESYRCGLSYESRGSSGWASFVQSTGSSDTDSISQLLKCGFVWFVPQT